jgi:hypothetical protein
MRDDTTFLAERRAESDTLEQISQRGIRVQTLKTTSLGYSKSLQYVLYDITQIESAPIYVDAAHLRQRHPGAT